MTDDKITLRTLLEKSSDADLLREMIGFSAQRLMELEVEGRTGAEHGERTPERINHRNGYRDRPWETRAGTVDLKIPKEHRAKLHSTNPLERVNGEIKRRTNVVGIFPNEDAITRLVGAVLLEQNDEWTVGRRYMTLESIAPLSDNPTIKLSAVAA